MNRKRIAVLMIALICAGGLAITAATVSTPTGGNPGEGVGTGSGSSGQPDRPEEEREQQSIDIPDWLQSLAIGLFVLSILIASYLSVRRMNAESTVKMLAIVAVVFFLLLAVMAAMADSPSFERDGGEPEPDNESGAAGGEGGPGRQPTENPTQSTDLPAALVGVFGVVVLLLVVTIYRFSGSDSEVDLPEAADEEEAGGSGAVQAVGEAAGRAADDLAASDGDAENAVYRAWREMTDALNVDNARTTTPEEFADVAIDAGMTPDDVRELTWLFEEVRYGNATVTGDRERRAQQALRRVQETYAGREDSDE